MAERDTFVPVNDGDQLNDGFFNGIYDTVPKLAEVYTGTGFDSSQSGVGNDEDSYELTSISATNLNSNDYVKVTINGTALTDTDSGAVGTTQVELKIQSKEIGGSYADSLAYKTVWAVWSDDDSKSEGNINLVYYHPLTSGEKTNGVQIKVFSKSTVSVNIDSRASFTNINTILEIVSDNI